jgi:hypothetical protein
MAPLALPLSANGGWSLLTEECALPWSIPPEEKEHLE